jgi:mRNA interferase MazF
MRRGEIWWADTGVAGGRPVLVLTRNPVADRIDRVVVAHLTTTVRGLSSELRVGIGDGLDRAGVVTFDNINTLQRSAFRRRLACLDEDRMDEACRVLGAALGCRV